MRRREPPPPPLKPGEQWITIVGPRGERNVRAFLVPDTEELFAVHFEHGDDCEEDSDSWWSTTHLPSGLTIKGPNRPLPKSREEATSLALAFFREWRKRDWSTLHSADIDTLRGYWSDHSVEERQQFWWDVYGDKPKGETTQCL